MAFHSTTLSARRCGLNGGGTSLGDIVVNGSGKKPVIAPIRTMQRMWAWAERRRTTVPTAGAFSCSASKVDSLLSPLTLRFELLLEFLQNLFL